MLGRKERKKETTCLISMYVYIIGKALSSGNQHYFFTQVKENNRSTENGYWKEIGVTKPIVTSSAADENKVGMKKYLVFFTLPQGTETSWVMEEFHISSSGGLINTSCGVTTTRPGRRNINHPVSDLVLFMS